MVVEADGGDEVATAADSMPVPPTFGAVRPACVGIMVSHGAARLTRGSRESTAGSGVSGPQPRTEGATGPGEFAILAGMAER